MKAIRFVAREFFESMKLTLKLPEFWAQRSKVRNAITIYLIVSSFVIRVGVRACHALLRRRFVPIVVKHRNNLTLYYPLHAYLNHAQDLFTPYGAYYMTAYEDLFGVALSFEKGDVVIDIGAHIGTFCVPLAFESPVRVLAVEPSRVNARYLRENVDRNELGRRVQVFEQAIFSKPGLAEFVEGDASTRGSLTATPFNRMRAGAHYSVATTTLRELMAANSISSVKLLKVDCEGAEYDLFYGMDASLFDVIENIFVEVHRLDDPGKPEQLIAFIEARGFVSRNKKLENGCYEVFCSRAVAA